MSKKTKSLQRMADTMGTWEKRVLRPKRKTARIRKKAKQAPAKPPLPQLRRKRKRRRRSPPSTRTVLQSPRKIWRNLHLLPLLQKEVDEVELLLGTVVVAKAVVTLAGGISSVLVLRSTLRKVLIETVAIETNDAEAHHQTDRTVVKRCVAAL
jgi:hypothetical protein